jgi:hypothetical protein
MVQHGRHTRHTPHTPPLAWSEGTDGGRGREVQEAQDLGVDAAQHPHLTSKQNTHKNEGLMDANE